MKPAPPDNQNQGREQKPGQKDTPGVFGRRLGAECEKQQDKGNDEPGPQQANEFTTRRRPAPRVIGAEEGCGYPAARCDRTASESCYRMKHPAELNQIYLIDDSVQKCIYKNHATESYTWFGESGRSHKDAAYRPGNL